MEICDFDEARHLLNGTSLVTPLYYIYHVVSTCFLVDFLTYMHPHPVLFYKPKCQMFGTLTLYIQYTPEYTALYIACTAFLLCPPGPLLAVPCDTMYCVTMKVASAPMSPGKIPAHLLHQANKVFSDSPLWFVDFPCYEHKLHVTCRTLGKQSSTFGSDCETN